MDFRAEQAAALTAAAAAVSAGKLSISKARMHFGANLNKLHRVLQGRQSAYSEIGAPTAMPRVVGDKLAEKLSLLVITHMYLIVKDLPIPARRVFVPFDISAPRGLLAQNG